MANGAGGADVFVQLRAGVDQFKSKIKEADDAVGRIRINLGHLNGLGGAGIQIYERMGITMGELAQVAGLILLVHQMKSLVETGMHFNAQLEQMTLGIKSVYAANIDIVDAQGQQVTGMDKLRVAGEEVEILMGTIKTDALLTVATLSQITGIMQVAMGPAMQMGLTMAQTEKVVVGLVMAAGAMGRPIETVAHEARALMEGIISRHTPVAKALGLTNEMIRLWKSQGTFFVEISKRLETFALAGKEAGDTWVGITSTMQDFKEQLLGAIMHPAHEMFRLSLVALRDSLGEVRNGVFVFNKEVKNTVATFAEIATAVAGGILNLVRIGVTISTFIVSHLRQINEAGGGWLMWGARIAGWMTLGNLALGLLTKMVPVFVILARAIGSATGAMTLFKIATAGLAFVGAEGWLGRLAGVAVPAAAVAAPAVGAGAVAALTGAGAAGTALMAKNMTALMGQSVVGSAPFMAKNMTALMGGAAAGATGGIFATLMGHLRSIPGLIKKSAGSLVGFIALLPGWGQAILAAVAVVGTGWALWNYFVRDVRTEHEKLNAELAEGVKTAQDARTATVGRKETAMSLVEILKDQAMTEMDVKDAVLSAGQSFTELHQFFGQEIVDRATVLSLMEQMIPLLAEGEAAARRTVVQAISNQVKETERHITALRDEITEQKRLIALKGGPEAAPDNVKRLVAAQKDLLTAELQRLTLQKKSQLELEAAKITAKKRDDDEKTKQARFDKEESTRKKDLSVLISDLAEQEALLTKQKELGFISEEEFLIRSMAIRKQRVEAELAADKLALEAKIAHYQEEGKSLDELETLRIQHATRAADKESDLRRDALKNETQIVLNMLKLQDALSAARLKGALGDVELQRARLDAAKTLGQLTAQEEAKGKRVLDLQQEAIEKQRLADRMTAAIGEKEHIDLQADIDKAQVDRQASAMRHAAELEKIRKDDTISEIDRMARLAQLQKEYRAEEMESASDAAHQAIELERERLKALRPGEAPLSIRPQGAADQMAIARLQGTIKMWQESLAEAERVTLSPKLYTDAVLDDAIRRFNNAHDQIDKLQNELAEIQKVASVPSVERPKVRTELERNLALMDAEYKLTLKGIDLEEKRGARNVELDKKSINQKITDAHSKQGLDQEAMRRSIGDAEAKLALDKTGTEAAKGHQRELDDLRAQYERMKVSGIRQIDDLNAQMQRREIAGTAEVTAAHRKAAEDRYQAAESSLRKQLDMEQSLRSSTLETLDQIQRFQLAKKLGVSLLELPEKFEELPSDRRAELTKEIRKQRLTRAQLAQLGVESGAALSGEVGATQEMLTKGGTLEFGQFFEQAKLLQEVWKNAARRIATGLPIQEIISAVFGRIPTELTEGFAKRIGEIDAFKKLKDSAVLSFDIIVEKSQAMYDRLAAQGLTFQQAAGMANMSDAIFENVYARLTRRLEQESDRY